MIALLSEEKLDDGEAVMVAGINDGVRATLASIRRISPLCDAELDCIEVAISSRA